MIDTIVIVLFALVMLANVVALARHWMMMRVLTVALNNMVRTQQEFNELIDRENAKKATSQDVTSVDRA
jgi:hypothetical protein